MQYGIFPISESALTIDFGNLISVELNETVLLLANLIKNQRFSGLVEVVPAYSSLTIFYDIIEVKQETRDCVTAYDFVKDFVESAIQKLPPGGSYPFREFEIPVDYSAESAPDLDFVASNAGLTADEVVKIHSSMTYRVFMIGFLPAFAYMGLLDERIEAPRKQTPSRKIAGGSVGIAGKQTGIYPFESPGGWQIIGRTNLRLFEPQKNEISLLKAGDRVRFIDINTK